MAEELTTALEQLSLDEVPNGVEPDAEADSSQSGERAAGEDSDTQQGPSVGVVLDHYYLEKCLVEEGLAKAWDPAVLIDALRHCLEDQLGESVDMKRDHLHAADSELAGIQSRKAKGRLHGELAKAGFQMHLSPTKSTKLTLDNAPRQGATDVDVVTSLFHLSGAFSKEGKGLVDHIILVGPDADFKPALAYILSNGPPGVSFWIVSSPDTMKSSYKDWIQQQSSAFILDLHDVTPFLHQAAGQARVCFERGKMTKSTVVRDVVMPRLVKALGQKLEKGVVLSLAKNWAWKKKQTVELAVCLKELDEPLRCSLTQLWLHHTGLDDSAVPALVDIVTLLPGLRELHLSHTGISKDGLELLGECLSTLYGSDRPRDGRLYVNAAELEGATIGDVENFWENHQDSVSVLCHVRVKETTSFDRYLVEKGRLSARQSPGHSSPYKPALKPSKLRSSSGNDVSAALASVSPKKREKKKTPKKATKSSSPASRLGKPGTYKTVACKYFSAGKCSFGEECSFIHE